MTYPEDDRRPLGNHDDDRTDDRAFGEPAEGPGGFGGGYPDDRDGGYRDGFGGDGDDFGGGHRDGDGPDERDDRGGDRPAPGDDAAVGEGDATDKAATALMAALIVLTVVASVVMLFTSSTGWMKIGVLAGLWAAVIGAILVTRYRRQLAAERRRIADLEVLHELELDRELATHREQELILEQNYFDSLESRDDDTIAQLRAEIVALREHLAELLGRDLDEERIALRARAERLRELDSPRQAPSPLKDPVANGRSQPRATAHRTEATAEGRVGAFTTHGPVGAGRQDRDEEPVEVPVVEGGTSGTAFDSGTFRATPWQQADAPDHEADWGISPDDSGDKKPGDEKDADKKDGKSAEAKDAVKATGPKRPETRPVTRTPDAAESRPTAVLPRIDEEPLVGSVAEGSDEAAGKGTDVGKTADAGEKAETAEATGGTEQALTGAGASATGDDAEAGAGDAGRRSRGRRRAEDHADGLTVAELLAQMRSRKQDGERN